MYHPAGTGLTVIILYLVSFLFYKSGIISLHLHRKIWNILLAFIFLSTALAGLFLAFQITYKWDIPYIKDILRLHVQTGVLLACTGIFHLLWHLSYYFRNSENEIHKSDQEGYKINSSAWPGAGTNLFIIGFVSSSVQYLLLREMMNITGGYELIAGVFLSIWLIISAAGSYLAGRSNLSHPARLNLIFSLSPVLTLTLLIVLSYLFLQPGETPSVLTGILFIIIILLPFCFISGFIFIKLTSSSSLYQGYKPGRSFSVETSGGIVAGLLLSLLMAGELGTYKLFLVIVLMYSAYTLLNYFIKNNFLKYTIRVLYAVIIAIILITEPDIIFRQLLMHGIKITENRDTPYGNLTTGDYKGEKSVFYNQRLLQYNSDVIEREEDIHYAMLQHSSPRKVILISGSLESHIKEIFKYPVESLIYIERDPALSVFQVPDSLKGKTIIANSDAFSYVRQNKWKGDVVIMLIPPPSTLLLNRYFTKEFFSEIHNKLERNGIFMCQSGYGDDYQNEQSIKLNSSVYNTLKSVFRNVKIVPGNKTYMVASDTDLSLKFCELTEEKGIKNLYVSADYLADDITLRKSNEILNLLDKNIKINTAAYPLTYNYFQHYHLSRTNTEKVPLAIILGVLFAVPLFTAGRKNPIMYFSASSLAGFEIIALITLQLTAGNMYQMTGVVLAGLMTGLAAGSAKDYRSVSWFRNVRYTAFILTCFYIFTGIVYPLFLEINSRFLALLLLCCLVFIPAFFTGMIFRNLTTQTGDREVRKIYSSDLSGSALGFIIISIFVIPYFGTSVTVILLGLLVLTGITADLIINRK